MRTFDTGATRDDNTHKLNYVRGLSAQVQQRYLEYLGSHRLQKDGSLRDWDNWKRGIDVEAYRESLLRHANDAVRASMNLPVPENASLEDLLCAVLFNASGWLFELLAAKSGNREGAEFVPWEQVKKELAITVPSTCGDCCGHRTNHTDDGGCTCPADDTADPRCFKSKGGA